MDRGIVFDHFTTLLGGKKINEAGFNASNAILGVGGVGKPVLSPLVHNDKSTVSKDYSWIHSLILAM